MYKLERICLHNWGMARLEDVEIRDATFFIGPTGAGKSSIVDAVQTVITGNNRHNLKLNAAAEGKDDRKVRDYCIGVIDDLPDHMAAGYVGDGPNAEDKTPCLRENCETTLALVFRDDDTGMPLTIGVMLSANMYEAKEKDRQTRFIAEGLAMKIQEFVFTGTDGQIYPLTHAEMIDRIEKTPSVRLTKHNSSATGFVEAYLGRMRRRGAQPSAKWFLRTFRNMVAFEPVQNATQFVRDYVLKPDPLDVNRVRDTIEHWRNLKGEVEEMEAKLAELGRLHQRYNAWGEAYVGRVVNTFVEAHAERRRLETDLAQTTETRDKLQTDQEREEAAKANHTAAIKSLDDQIERQLAYRTNSPQNLKLQKADGDIKHANDAIARVRNQIVERANAVGALARLQTIRECVPNRLHPGIEAANAVKRVAQQETAPDVTEIDRLERQALQLVEAHTSLSNQREAIGQEISDLGRERDDLKAQVDAAGTGAVLSPKVRQFRQLLQERGIEVTALPDVCEVTDERWAQAAEQLLGPNREAFIVDDQNVREAHELLFKNRREFSSCRIISPARLKRANPNVKPGSIAEVVRTSHPIAEAFIAQHLGGFIMVDTAEELEAHDRAIMRNGKMQGGATLRVHQDLVPILGKTAQDNALRKAQERLDEVDRELEALKRRKGGIDAALRTMTLLAGDDEAPQVPAPQLPDLLHRLDTAAGELRSAQAAREAVDDPELRKIDEEIKRLKNEKAEYIRERDEEIEDALKKLRDKLTGVEKQIAKLESAREAAQTREDGAVQEAEELASLAGNLENPDSLEAARQRVEVALLHNQGNERETLANARRDAEKKVEELRNTERTRRQRADQDFRKFYETRYGSNPIEAGKDAPSTRLAWIILTEHRIEQNELRPHREKVQQAWIDMERALREDLLTKLADKFMHVRTQLDTLNRRLQGRVFNEMTYQFRRSTDPNLTNLHDLAKRIAEEPEHGQKIIQNEEGDDTVRKAMEQVEAILNRDDDTSFLEDYRNYFTFELYMQPKHGGDPIPLSKRSRTASAGQRQAPFYVAIAASMAAAYYPGSRGNDADGMGLVLFDEAFNRLDVPTTHKLLEFFKSMNLQVLVAVPEAHRPTFLETMDTMITVNKSTAHGEIRIQSKGIKEHAKDTIARANPRNRTLEEFRREFEAAQGASANTSEAAAGRQTGGSTPETPPGTSDQAAE